MTNQHPTRVRVRPEVSEGSERTSEGRQVPPHPPLIEATELRAEQASSLSTQDP